MRQRLAGIVLILLGMLIMSLPGSAGMLIDCTGGVSCDDCGASNLTFSWYMEGGNTTDRLNVNSGTPPTCGCSSGDATGTITGDIAFSTTYKKDGLVSLYAPTGQDSVAFNSASIITSRTGTIEFWVRIHTWATSHPCLFYYQYDSNNTLRVYEVGTSSSDIEFRLYYDAGSMTSITLDTNAVNASQGGWYRVVVKRRATGDPNLGIYVYDTAGQLLDYETDNTDLQAFSTEASTFSIGSHMATSPNEPLMIDGVKIWNVWK